MLPGLRLPTSAMPMDDVVLVLLIPPHILSRVTARKQSTTADALSSM
jgi:hypothetical protein